MSDEKCAQTAEKLADLYAEITDIMCEDAFFKGFSLGVGLISEAINGKLHFD